MKNTTPRFSEKTPPPYEIFEKYPPPKFFARDFSKISPKHYSSAYQQILGKIPPPDRVFSEKYHPQIENFRKKSRFRFFFSRAKKNQNRDFQKHHPQMLK